MYFTCLDGGLGGSDSKQPNSPSGSAREGPYACGGKSLGGSGKLNLFYFTCLEGVWGAHSVVFYEALRLLDVQLLTQLSARVGSLEKEPRFFLRARV